MIIYIDLLLFLNLVYDTLIFLTVNYTLKRNISLKRIVCTSLLGELSILLLLVPRIYQRIGMFLLGILLNVVCFRYKNLLYTVNNLIYFFMTSFLLAGFSYLLQENNLPYILTFLGVPLILYLQYKETQTLKEITNSYQEVLIYWSDTRYLKTIGFKDTGNHLKDPVTHKDIILVSKELIPTKMIRAPILVPITTCNKKSLLPCIKPYKVYIDSKEYNCLVGCMEEKIKIEGADCLLNYNT